MSPRSTALALAAARLDSLGLRQLFLEARSHSRWQPLPVDDAVLRKLYELARMPPTAANSQPMRVVFVQSAEAKARELELLLPGWTIGLKSSSA